ncbi:putative Nucleotide-diphospho-sugar transferase [Seiridium cardinale]|uniref:Mannose-1-phosphate guanyltransferase n=1 Tax=Seiridium cardinale TaxID=138064 RepID=A0ABR2XQD4_9PEZI
MSGKGAKGKKPAKAGAEDKREDVLQAVVIADTFQTRFRPFSLEKPRCLLPLANTPLIEYTLEFLAMNGVQEVFIYAGAHTEQIESYIRQSRWTPLSRACPFSSLEFIRVSDARSIGDFLRDLDNKSLIDGDFILVHGDTVSNISLDSALAAHRARKEANRDSMMTLVLREGGENEHQTKVKGTTPVFAVDPRAKRCLHYEEMDPFQADHYVSLDPDLLKTRELDIRSDLIDAEIDICTPDVLAQWAESFDYELPRAQFLNGVLKDYELNGKMIHTEIVSEGYSARASNFQMFEAISRDVLGGWAYPFAPDNNLVKGQTYQQWEDNVYREDDIHFGPDGEVSNSVIGRDSRIGSGSTIVNSFIGRDCIIGNNVQIRDSFLWDDVTIEDGALIEHSIVAEFTNVGKRSKIGNGSLIASGVHISDDVTLPPATVLSLISSEGVSVPSDTELLGPKGKGARFQDSDFDEIDDDDPCRLQKSLNYSLEGFDLEDSDVSTIASEEEFDEDDAQFLSGSRDDSRSRLSSFASDDSSGGATSFVSEAVHGLLEVLRGESGGDFSSEKLEFMSLRLANNASDTSVRRAVATAFVRRAVELSNVEGGGFDPNKAAKTTLTERKGAKEFIMEVGVGGGSVSEQVEFAMAVQKACVSTSRVIEVPRAGTLCAALFQHMYEEEVLEEDGILGWWGDERSSEGEPMAGVREKCQVLVNWLEQAEEEDSEEESEEEEDDE